MAESRRLRPQAERDADGTTWHPGGVVRGEPVAVELDPDECVLVVREGVGVMCVRDHETHDEGVVGRVLPPLPECMYADDAAPIVPPRRRWWHRYTRRNP